MTADSRLQDLRQRMDAINDRLVAVLTERAALVREIGGWKARHGIALVDPEREAAMLQRLLAHASPAAGFPRGALERLLRAVFAESRALIEDPRPQ